MNGKILIQALLLAAVARFFISTLVRRRRGDIDGRTFYFWAALWIAAAVVVIFPDATTRVAESVGVGRGADLITYLSLTALFYGLFRVLTKIEKLNRNLTELVRLAALDERDRADRAMTATSPSGPTTHA